MDPPAPTWIPPDTNSSHLLLRTPFSPSLFPTPNCSSSRALHLPRVCCFSRLPGTPTAWQSPTPSTYPKALAQDIFFPQTPHQPLIWPLGSLPSLSLHSSPTLLTACTPTWLHRTPLHPELTRSLFHSQPSQTPGTPRIKSQSLSLTCEAMGGFSPSSPSGRVSRDLARLVYFFPFSFLQFHASTLVFRPFLLPGMPVPSRSTSSWRPFLTSLSQRCLPPLPDQELPEGEPSLTALWIPSTAQS